MKRHTILFTYEEKKQFKSLRSDVGSAFEFWQRVANSRDLDYQTIMYDDGFYHALPIGHRKHWCWPKDIKCPIKAEDVKI